MVRVVGEEASSLWMLDERVSLDPNEGEAETELTIISQPQLLVVLHQRFQDLVDLDRTEGETDVEGCKRSKISEGEGAGKGEKREEERSAS